MSDVSNERPIRVQLGAVLHHETQMLCLDYGVKQWFEEHEEEIKRKINHSRMIHDIGEVGLFDEIELAEVQE